MREKRSTLLLLCEISRNGDITNCQRTFSCSDHKSLQFINDQGKLNQKHTKWVKFLQIYSFVLKHMS